MLGMGNNDDEQRFWNLCVFKIYATDKEIEEMTPVLGVILAIILIGLGAYWLFC